MGGFMAQKVLWNLARATMLQDRGALPKEEGDIVKEYKAMHEENFLSSWLREYVEDEEERRRNVDKETREEVSRLEKEKAREERTKRWLKYGVSSLFFSVMLLRNSVREEDSDCCGKSWDDLTLVVCLIVCLKCRRVCLV